MIISSPKKMRKRRKERNKKRKRGEKKKMRKEALKLAKWKGQKRGALHDTYNCTLFICGWRRVKDEKWDIIFTRYKKSKVRKGGKRK